MAQNLTNKKVEIDIPIFERNMKLINRKGLRRSYVSAYTHPTEYMEVAPLSSTPKMVFEVTIDKDSVMEFQEFLKNKGFTVLGSVNNFHMENLVNDYNKYKKFFEAQQDRINNIQAEIDKNKAECKDYLEIENDDAKFYFMPYNEGIETIFEFIKTQKDDILKFSKDKDITIMIRACAFTNQLDGFMGFNFYDADQKGEVVVDYAARFTVAVDFNMVPAIYAAAVVLSGIGESKEELAEPDLNVHLIAEHIKYQKA